MLDFSFINSLAPQAKIFRMCRRGYRSRIYRSRSLGKPVVGRRLSGMWRRGYISRIYRSRSSGKPVVERRMSGVHKRGYMSRIYRSRSRGKSVVWRRLSGVCKRCIGVEYIEVWASGSPSWGEGCRGEKERGGGEEDKSTVDRRNLTTPIWRGGENDQIYEWCNHIQCSCGGGHMGHKRTGGIQRPTYMRYTNLTSRRSKGQMSRGGGCYM